MTIKLYDLTDATRTIFFSPYCWRTRMALAHKALSFESIPWHFTDAAEIEHSGQKRVPVIVDDGNWVHDSHAIALYLDRAYPDRPMLMKDSAAIAQAEFVNAWCLSSIFPALRPIAVHPVFKIIHEKDKSYFRSSREAMMGTTLEETSTDPIAEKHNLATALQPAEKMLANHSYFGGGSPDYADYVLFGTLMWPYQVTGDAPIDPNSHVGAWFESLLHQFSGLARNAPRAMRS
ncbi:MAG: glutathione S-transferase N-terminal domain-containing protein [Hyphomicrobiaceae bacterium]